MIKSWLEIGNDVLAQARVLCFNQLTSARSHSSTYNSASNAANNNTTTSTSTSHTHPTNTTANPTATNANTSTTANPLDEQSQHDIRESCRAFMEAFGPAYELISNAAAALMHLSGMFCLYVLIYGNCLVGSIDSLLFGVFFSVVAIYYLIALIPFCLSSAPFFRSIINSQY